MDGMETAAGLASYFIDRLRGLRASHLLLALLLMLVSVAVTLALAGVFPSASGPIVVAPFRW